MPEAAPEGKCRVNSDVRSRTRRRTAGLAVGLAAISGCFPSGRVTSTGSVTFDGRPVETGAIVFLPLDRGTTVEGAAIEAGRFRITGRPGKRRVQIRGTRVVDPDKVPRTMARFEGVPVHEDYIPAVYNVESTLEVEVTAAGPNTFDFDLQSPPP